MSRRRQLTRLTLWLQCLFAVIACAEPEQISIGLIGLSNSPPLELNCIAKNPLPDGDICDLTHLSVGQNQFELSAISACGAKSADYATSHQLVNFLRKQPIATLYVTGPTADKLKSLKCHINQTTQNTIYDIQPHN